jgi:hypothetical protein
MIQRYVSKICGPLLDRIDIHIEVPAVKYKGLRTPALAEDSEAVRAENLLECADVAGDAPQTLRYLPPTVRNYWKMPSPVWAFPRMLTSAS